MDISRFYIEDGKVKLKSHKITIRRYRWVGVDEYETLIYNVSNEELTEWVENFIPKHKLYMVESVEEYDNSNYQWVEGLELRTNNWKQEIKDILQCGSLEAYRASLPESQDNLMLDMMCDIAELRLGISEEV